MLVFLLTGCRTSWHAICIPRRRKGRGNRWKSHIRQLHHPLEGKQSFSRRSIQSTSGYISLTRIWYLATLKLIITKGNEKSTSGVTNHDSLPLGREQVHLPEDQWLFPILSRYHQDPASPHSVFCPDPVATVCHSGHCYHFPLWKPSAPSGRFCLVLIFVSARESHSANPTLARCC